MNITVITVGKPHNNLYKQSINEFENRLSHYTSVKWLYIPTSDTSRESQQILKQMKGYCFVLDESGKSLTTPALADKIEVLKNNSLKDITFIIGGAYGVSDEVKAKADFLWSLSGLVFPHQLVRLILIEQLYRSFNILAGGNYHHE